MNSYPVTKGVLNAVYTRLTANSEGFNETFADIAPSYGIATTAVNFTFTPVQGSSPNFAMGNIDPEDWQQTSPFKYPFMTLFGTRSTNQNEQKFHQFSGEVGITINIFLAWKQGRVLENFTDLSGAVEDTMYNLFNRARNGHPGDQDWWGADFDDTGIVFNGDISMQTSRIERGGEFWRQLLAFPMTFEVHQQGEV